MTGESILIVEDEPAVARGLEYGLSREGFEVLWAETGQAALDLARTRDPHLILLDIRLPDISGFDVCRQLRAEGQRQPILMLTARDEELDKVLGLELGADDYVVKPYSLRELISRIRALLRRAYGELAVTAPGNRLRFGDIELDLERLQATRDGELVEASSTAFKTLAQGKGIDFAIEKPALPLQVVCDRARLELALSNLLDNALKFTPPGGRVAIGAEPAGEGVRLWVRDSGPGIDPAEQPHIFGRFYQGQNGQPDSPRGDGLGLTIVHSVVQAHGARVWVESEPGEGSLFIVQFPSGNHSGARHF